MKQDDSFASLFAAEERAPNQRRLTRGEVVEATIVHIGADTIFLDIGTPADGRLERSDLGESDNPDRWLVGDRIRATVIDARPDAPRLATVMGRGGDLDARELELAKESGAAVSGCVAKVVKAGLEVDIGGTRAFCPMSHVDIVRAEVTDDWVGQTLEFRVLEVRDRGRSVVISRRLLLEDQRKAEQKRAAEKLSVGQLVEGTVKALNRHGAVIDLGGIDGFAHVSELSEKRVEKPQDVLAVGAKVTAKLLLVDESSSGVNIRLSLKTKTSEEQRNFDEFAAKARGKSRGFGSLGDLLREKLDLPERVERPSPVPRPVGAGTSAQRIQGEPPPAAGGPKATTRRPPPPGVIRKRRAD